jgi:hypothetical protein
MIFKHRNYSWSLVVTRGHSWSLVVTRGHSWSLVVTRVYRTRSICQTLCCEKWDWSIKNRKNCIKMHPKPNCNNFDQTKLNAAMYACEYFTWDSGDYKMASKILAPKIIKMIQKLYLYICLQSINYSLFCSYLICVFTNGYIPSRSRLYHGNATNLMKNWSQF